MTINYVLIKDNDEHVSHKKFQGRRAIASSKDFTADIVFLVDSSSTVGVQNYDIEKDVIKSLASTFNLGSGRTRAAVVAYGGSARRVLSLTDTQSSENFDREVSNMPFLGGRRRIDNALEEAALLLTEARPNTPKVVILMAAGRHYTAAGSRGLDVSSQPLREMGAQIYVVAIGRDIDSRELTVVASLRRNIISSPNFKMLPAQMKRIASAIRSGAGT